MRNMMTIQPKVLPTVSPQVIGNWRAFPYPCYRPGFVNEKLKRGQKNLKQPEVLLPVIL
jgi:hypothetical protein